MDDKCKPIDSDSPREQMIGRFRSVDPPKITPVYPTIDYDLIYRQMLSHTWDTGNNSIIPAEYFEKSQEYQLQSLEILKSINQNTANLYTLVDLISKSNEQQDEIIEITSEILTIAKAKEKKEAESFFKKVITRINSSVATADSVIKLISWATIFYRIVITMLP